MVAEDSGAVLRGGGGVNAVICFENFGLPKPADSDKVRAQRVDSGAFSVLRGDVVSAGVEQPDSPLYLHLLLSCLPVRCCLVFREAHLAAGA